MTVPFEDPWLDEPPRVRFSLVEAMHLLASVVVLTIAFALVLGIRSASSGGPIGFGFQLDPTADVPRLLLFSALAVVPAFILHELAHKVVAQRMDMWAEFRANPIGLVAGLLVPALTGFLFASPGAVEIVGHADRRDAGTISIVGPLVNLGLAALALLLDPVLPPVRIAGFGSYFQLVALLNIILAGFNMLPIGPLDGRKVWRWSKLAFAGTWAFVLGLGFVFFH
jgi:Zn-dependent protease